MLKKPHRSAFFFFFPISISKKLDHLNRLDIKLSTLAELLQVTYRVSFLYFRNLKGLLIPQNPSEGIALKKTHL